WQDNVDVKWRDMSYDDAREYCNTMQLAGYDDWRLPKLSTLKRIVVSENYPMTIVNVFETSDSEYYWSVSSYQKKYAWMISFRDGSVEYYHKTDTNYVRCVRDYSPSQ
ncbi:MAG TPA: DUF1566 domain-containing protein, partial [Helicobacteraceae bacterium]|nr:DUF1566 domain-containing protein [Helicobacteraceae bacterium]